MKGLRRTVSLLLAGAVLAYLWLAPQYLADALGRDHYREWLEPEREPYTGIITVLHVVGFKPYTGSLGSWIEKQTARMEKRHSGVFFEVLSLAAEEAEAYLARGGSADVYSFPLGWTYAEQLQTLGIAAPSYPDGLRDVGRSGGLLALPYALSGRCLLVNTDLLNERGVALPEDGITDAWLREAEEKLTFEKKGKTICAFAGDAVTAARLGVDVPVAEYDAFLSQGAAAAFADLRAAGDLSRLVEAGKGFAFRAYPIDADTDEVQLLGIAKGMAAEKLPYAEEFLLHILSEETQTSLVELGLFPAVLPQEMQKYANDLLCACAEIHRDPVVPNSFDYHRERDALYDAAVRALSGDVSGLKDFEARRKGLYSKAK